MKTLLAIIILVSSGCGTVSVGVNYNDGPTNATIAYHANLAQMRMK
jgi:uncharacterized protein YceK